MHAEGDELRRLYLPSQPDRLAVTPRRVGCSRRVRRGLRRARRWVWWSCRLIEQLFDEGLERARAEMEDEDLPF